MDMVRVLEEILDQDVAEGRELESEGDDLRELSGKGYAYAYGRGKGKGKGKKYGHCSSSSDECSS